MSILNNSFNSFLASSPSGGGGGGVSGSGTGNFLPKWASSTALTNSQLFDNGTSVGVGTSTPTSGFLLDVNTSGIFRTLLQIGTSVVPTGAGHIGNLFTDGTIEASVGVNIAPITNSPFNKTGFYWATNSMSIFAGNSQIGRVGLNSSGGDYLSITAAFTPNSSAGGTGTLNGLRLKSGVQPASNTNNTSNQNQLTIDPIINQVNGTGTGSGTIRGIFYDPTVTNLATSPHFAFESTSGDIKFGNFAGTGNRVVMADSLGKLVDQATLTAFRLFYSSAANGIDIDFANGTAKFGLFTRGIINVNQDELRAELNNVTNGLLLDGGNTFYRFGQLDTTTLDELYTEIDGSLSTFKIQYNTIPSGLNFDFAGDIFEFGSLAGDAKISLDNGNSEVIFGNSQTAGFTEIQANELKLTGANLETSGSGAGSASYLVVRVNNVAYTIEMKGL